MYLYYPTITTSFISKPPTTFIAQLNPLSPITTPTNPLLPPITTTTHHKII